MEPSGQSEVIPYATRIGPPPRASHALLIIALVVGVGGNALSLWAAWSLWSVPPGSSIRPMGQAALIGLASLGSAAVGVPLAVTGWVRSVNRLRSSPAVLIILLLCLSPWYAGTRLWKYIETTHGLIMEP